MSPIRYCGNCNPDWDPRQVKERLVQVFGRDPGARLIWVNGCVRACLWKMATEDQKAMGPLVLSASEIMRERE